MTLSDLDIAESYFKLQEAIQILSHTIKQLETFHFQKNKLKSSPIHSVTGVRAGQETEMQIQITSVQGNVGKLFQDSGDSSSNVVMQYDAISKRLVL